jgi:RND superfamily putative drug exporter
MGRWSIRRPWWAIAAWVAFVVLAVASLAVTGTKSLNNGAVGESARGYALMDRYQLWSNSPVELYLHSDRLRTGDRPFASALRRIAHGMHSTLGTRVRVEISGDRHSGLLAAPVDRPPRGNFGAAIAAVRGAYPQLAIVDLGNVAHNGHNDLRKAEELSLPVTLLVLLFAFGSIVAALTPMLLALTAVVAAFGLLGPVSHAFPLDDSVKTVVLLIGMAVGVDYALFYVVRSREERTRGLSSHEALERTARTSGRTVVISGSVVAIAMSGMFIVGSDVLNGIASGTVLVVACAVAGSVTVLPAVLELVGPRIDRGTIPYLPHLRTDGTSSRFWPMIVGSVLRRPLLAAALSAGILVALAVPALGMHVAKPSSDALASHSPLEDRALAEFPNLSEPALVVAAGRPAQRAQLADAIAQLEQLAAARGIAHPPFTLTASADRSAASVELPLTGLGDNNASRDAVQLLRRQLIPQTLGRVPGVETAVTGSTAEDVDFTHQMTHGFPYVVAFVLTLAFLLLLVAFRSLVVPLKAIVLNLLSVGAAYGVLVLVFEHHWAQGLLGFHSDGTIVSWLPIFLFVILFGLSMDYHVFILSRVRELVDSGMSTDAALRQGIARTAGVVTSAALVMVGVFSIFGTLSALDVKQAGVGLATAVLIDATIVRAILLPASMKLLGERNWYLPTWLAWLPKTQLDHSPSPTQVAAPEHAV